MKNRNLPKVLLMTLKNADVSKNLVTSYGFSRWHFFQEVLGHTHAKHLGKWPSGTVIFRVGVNLPPPPSRMIESEHPFTNRVNISLIILESREWYANSAIARGEGLKEPKSFIHILHYSIRFFGQVNLKKKIPIMVDN